MAVSADPDPHRAGLLAVAEAASQPDRRRVRSALLFAAGRHASAAHAVAAGAAEHLPDATIIVVGGSGVLSPEGESVGASAVTALALNVTVTAAVAGPVRDEVSARRAGEQLGDALSHTPPRPALLFCRPSAVVDVLLDTFVARASPTTVAGGGLSAEGTVAVVAPGEGIQASEALAVRFDGGVRMAVGASPAVERLTAWLPVQVVEDGMVLRAGGRPPLVLLTEAVRDRADRPLVLVAIAPPDGTTDREGACLVRGISGVDPTRGAVHLGSEVQEGDRIAFATLDPDASRRDVLLMLRHLERDMAGGVPLAGIYFDCAGRGERLYGRPGVDSRLIRDRFDELPFAGMRSSFEIAPFGDRPRTHVYTGVFALLFAPS